MTHKRYRAKSTLPPNRLINRPADGWPDSLDLSSLFPEKRPTELEIGSGRGLFLVNQSMKEPGHNFVGIEVANKFAVEAGYRLDECEAPNAKIIFGEARDFIRKLASESIRRVHVYFPDPWWKRRHKKRRLLAPDFIAQIARILEPAGILSFASDVHEYFTSVKSFLDTLPQFELPPEVLPDKPTDDLDYLTHFERKYRREGRWIGRARFVRTSVSAGDLLEQHPLPKLRDTHDLENP